MGLTKQGTDMWTVQRRGCEGGECERESVVVIAHTLSGVVFQCVLSVL